MPAAYSRQAYVVNQEYVVNELEAGYVRKIFDAAANREGFTAIIEELAAAGITGKRLHGPFFQLLFQVDMFPQVAGHLVILVDEDGIKAALIHIPQQLLVGFPAGRLVLHSGREDQVSPHRQRDYEAERY